MEENEMDNKKEKGKDIMVGGKVVLSNIFLTSEVGAWKSYFFIEATPVAIFSEDGALTKQTLNYEVIYIELYRPRSQANMAKLGEANIFLGSS